MKKENPQTINLIEILESFNLYRDSILRDGIESSINLSSSQELLSLSFAFAKAVDLNSDLDDEMVNTILSQILPTDDVNKNRFLLNAFLALTLHSQDGGKVCDKNNPNLH